MHGQDANDIKVHRAAASAVRSHVNQLAACVTALELDVDEFNEDSEDSNKLLRLRSHWVNTGAVIERLMEAHTAFGVALTALQASWQEFEAKYPLRQANARHASAQNIQTDPYIRAQERATWIQNFGSDYVRRLLRGGYDVERVYACERAAREHPGYYVDLDDNAEYENRVAPSYSALIAAEAVHGRVVLLRSLPYFYDREDDDDYQEYLIAATVDFEKCEAVLITKFLGKYDVIKPLPPRL